MQAIEHIRKNILKITQSAMADIAGVNQATVSRWERDGLEPTRDQLARIRDAARDRGIDWDDEWFFATPPAPNGEAA